jgi:hypothetical protein
MHQAFSLLSGASGLHQAQLAARHLAAEVPRDASHAAALASALQATQHLRQLQQHQHHERQQHQQHQRQNQRQQQIPLYHGIAPHYAFVSPPMPTSHAAGAAAARSVATWPAAAVRGGAAEWAASDEQEQQSRAQQTLLQLQAVVYGMVDPGMMGAAAAGAAAPSHQHHHHHQQQQQQPVQLLSVQQAPLPAGHEAQVAQLLQLQQLQQLQQLLLPVITQQAAVLAAALQGRCGAAPAPLAAGLLHHAWTPPPPQYPAGTLATQPAASAAALQGLLGHSSIPASSAGGNGTLCRLSASAAAPHAYQPALAQQLLPGPPARAPAHAWAAAGRPQPAGPSGGAWGPGYVVYTTASAASAAPAPGLDRSRAPGGWPGAPRQGH